MMLVLAILFSMRFFIISAENCANYNTTCECFDDFQLEIQCPNVESEEKIVLRKENFEHLRIECWNMEKSTNYPTLKFNTISQLSIVDCPIIPEITKMVQTDQLNQLEIENARLFTPVFLEERLRRLEKLYVKSTEINTKIQINSPFLTSIIVEEIFDEISMENAAGIFRENPNLLELSLSFNNMATLPSPELFRKLFKLQILHLSRNNLKSLPTGVFRDLHNLRVLNLDVNELETILNETFINLCNLHTLDISNNNLGKLTQELLKPLRNSLHVFYADHNARLELEAKLFANFDRLEIISLGHSNLHEIPADLFENSTKLIQLSMEHNHLTSLPIDLFKGLKDLKQLRLNNNKLKNILDSTFVTLQNLHVLQLQNNELEELNKKMLYGLSNLEVLNAEFNKITRISHDTFEKVGKTLEYLYLGHNFLTYEVEVGHFPSGNPFKACTSLKFLDLNNNALKDYMDDLFLYAKSLQFLDLNSNKITWIDLTTLWKVAGRGVMLNLENNEISRVFIESLNEMAYEYNEGAFEQLEKDSVVSISHNPLICDCYADTLREFLSKVASKNIGLIFKYDQLLCASPEQLKFHKLSQVLPEQFLCRLDELIEMPHCTDTTLCDCFWRPSDKTLVVDCARRNLTRAPQLFLPINLVQFNQTEVHLEQNLLESSPNFSVAYDNVTKLYLNSNKITKIEWAPTKIQVLNLYDNLIGNLGETIMKKFNESVFLKNLSFGGNPWKCNCESSNLFQFLRENAARLDVNRIKCENLGVKLVELNGSAFCEKHKWLFMISIVTFFVLTSIFLLFVLIYYKYRQEIHVWLYAKNLCTIFLRNRECDDSTDSHKKYDIFISYSHKDEQFVVENLVKVLENRENGFKVCLHYRDWIPGDLIAANIANSVANSRRTLVVLTRNFLESIWGKMEFRTAHAEALKERTNRVILLVKDEINVDLLDNELKSYINTNTYIRWDDEWFWKKLMYALPHRRNEIA